MDVERALLKIAVSIIALFAISQGTQGLKDYSLQRSAEIADKAKLAHSKNGKQIEQKKSGFNLKNFF